MKLCYCCKKEISDKDLIMYGGVCLECKKEIEGIYSKGGTSKDVNNYCMRKRRVLYHKKDSTFYYSWFDDGTLGDVVLCCKCGAETEIGMVDSYEGDILECKKCGRKYKIRMNIYLEEIEEDEYTPCKEAEKKIAYNV